MAPQIELDFSGAPPAQGSASTDIIPEGRYALKVERVEVGLATSGRRKITVYFKVASGPMAGKRLRDLFTLPSGPDDNKFGLQRFNALCAALGASFGERKVNFDTDSLLNKIMAADVIDGTIPANDRFPERPTSEPTAYHPLSVLKAPAPAAAAAPAPTPAPAPVAAAAAPAPAARRAATPAPAAATRPAPAPVAAPVAQAELPIGESVEDAFPADDPDGIPEGDNTDALLSEIDDLFK